MALKSTDCPRIWVSFLRDKFITISPSRPWSRRVVCRMLESEKSWIRITWSYRNSLYLLFCWLECVVEKELCLKFRIDILISSMLDSTVYKEEFAWKNITLTYQVFRRGVFILLLPEIRCKIITIDGILLSVLYWNPAISTYNCFFSSDLPFPVFSFH